jgi:hypothetical protein
VEDSFNDSEIGRKSNANVDVAHLNTTRVILPERGSPWIRLEALLFLMTISVRG